MEPNDEFPVKKTLGEINKAFAEKLKEQNQPPADPPNKPVDPPLADDKTKPTDPPKPDEQNQVTPLAWLNTKLNSKFEKEDEAEEHFRTLTEKSTLADQYKENLDKLTTENEELKKGFNPMSLFEDPKDYLYIELKKNNKGLDPNVLATLAFNEIKDIDKFDILTYSKLLKDPNHEIYETDADAEESIMEKYKEMGYDPELKWDEQPKNVRIRINEDVANARAELSKIKESVKLPEIIDVVKQKEENQKKFTERYNTIKSQAEPDIKKKVPALLDKVDVVDVKKGKDGKTEKETVFSFSMGEFNKSTHAKKELDAALEWIAKNVEAYSPEIAEQLIGESVRNLKGQFVLSHLPDMFKAAKEQWRAEWVKENNEAEHNPNKLDVKGANDVPKTEAERKKAEEESRFSQKVGYKGERQVFAR